jgi:hypothetical protein
MPEIYVSFTLMHYRHAIERQALSQISLYVCTSV